MTSKSKAAYALLGSGHKPRGISRDQAAAYIGVSPSHFDNLVNKGRMPRGRRLGDRLVWDVFELDKAFGASPHDEPKAPVQSHKAGESF